MIYRGGTRLALVLLAFILAGGSNAMELSAQSVSAGDGLGAPLQPLDARSRALGSVGIGLRGDRLVPTDPAALADLGIPSVTFTLQTSWADVLESEGAEPGTFQATRFPVIGVAYPVFGIGVFSLSFSTVLDQEWRVGEERRVDLGQSGGQARVTDRFTSEGGLGTVRIGFARRLNRTFSVGGTFGAYTGDVSRVFARTFDSIDAVSAVPAFTVGGQWRYSGLVTSLGGAADFGEIFRVSGSYAFGGSLGANPTDDTDGGEESFPMPDDLRLGASALLAPELSINAGLQRSDWSGTGELYDESEGYSALTWGTGLEFTGARLLGKPSALRVGYRSGGLPFAPTGSDSPSESVWSGGVGLDLFQAGPVVIAASDFTLERGSRTIGALTEEYWRFALSVRVSGR